VRVAALILVLSPSAAVAHLGHVGEAAGHDHWLGVAALAAAGIAALVGWRKRRQEAKEPEGGVDEEGPEAEAKAEEA